MAHNNYPANPNDCQHQSCGDMQESIRAIGVGLALCGAKWKPTPGRRRGGLLSGTTTSMDSAEQRELRRSNELFQEPLDVIELRLKLRKSCELNTQLDADVGELVFDGRQNLGSIRQRSCRAAFASLTGAPGRTTCAALAGYAPLAACALLATCAVLALWPPWACLGRHVGGAILPRARLG
jgi:hypothetical protein